MVDAEALGSLPGPRWFTATVPHVRRDLVSLAAWAGVSAATLAVVEASLLAGARTFYTTLYQSVRAARSPAIRLVPLVVAFVVFAHLEGLLPRRLDPLRMTGAAIARSAERTGWRS